jgi:hypothetical protein
MEARSVYVLEAFIDFYIIKQFELIRYLLMHEYVPNKHNGQLGVKVNYCLKTS